MNFTKYISDKHHDDDLHFPITWIGAVALTIIVLLVRLIFGSI